MARRKTFQSIAHNVLGSFISRNHDLEGYWALGQLYNACLEAQNLRFQLNLLTAETHPRCESFYHKLSKTYTIRFQQALSAQGLLREWVLEATLEIRFNQSPLKSDFEAALRQGRGELFEALLNIRDDQHRVYRARQIGRCARHHPELEQQRL